jgi:hypothetical protein
LRCTPPKPLASPLSSSPPPLFWPRNMPWPRRGAIGSLAVAMMEPLRVRAATTALSFRCGRLPPRSAFAWHASTTSRRC